MVKPVRSTNSKYNPSQHILINTLAKDMKYSPEYLTYAVLNAYRIPRLRDGNRVFITKDDATRLAEQVGKRRNENGRHKHGLLPGRTIKPNAAALMSQEVEVKVTPTILRSLIKAGMRFKLIVTE